MSKHAQPQNHRPNQGFFDSSALKNLEYEKDLKLLRGLLKLWCLEKTYKAFLLKVCILNLHQRPWNYIYFLEHGFLNRLMPSWFQSSSYKLLIFCWHFARKKKIWEKKIPNKKLFEKDFSPKTSKKKNCFSSFSVFIYVILQIEVFFV